MSGFETALRVVNRWRGVFSPRPEDEGRVKLRTRWSGPILRSILSLILVVLCLPIIAFWWLNTQRLIEGAPQLVRLERLEVRLAPNASVEVGRDSLAQAAAFDSGEVRHVRFVRVGDQVLVSNVASERKLFMRYADGFTTFAERVPLATGDKLRLGVNTLTFTPAGRTISITIEALGGRRVLALDASTAEDVLTIDGAPIRVCRPTGQADRLKRELKEIAARFSDTESVVLTLGGRSTCRIEEALHVSLEGADIDTLRLVRRGGTWSLAPGNARRRGDTPVFETARGERRSGFSAVTWPLIDPVHGALSRLTIGRTSYDVRLVAPDAGRIAIDLVPASKEHLFRVTADHNPVPEFDNTDALTRVVTDPPRPIFGPGDRQGGVNVMNGGERVVRFGLIAVMVAVAGLAFLVLPFRRRLNQEGVGAVVRDRALTSAVRFAVVAAAAGLVLIPEGSQLFGLGPPAMADALRGTILAFAIATFAIAFGGGLAGVGLILWFAILGLASFGTLTLLSLAIDATSTHWLIYLQKHKLLFLDIAVVAIVFVASLRFATLRQVLRRFAAGTDGVSAALRFVPAGLLVFAFLAWVIVGDEEGVYGFQPVEFGKVAVIVIVGVFLVGLERLTLGLRQSGYGPWALAAGASLIVFGVLLFLFPVMKSDYSPVLILGFTGLVLLFVFLIPWLARFVGRRVTARLKREDVPERFRPPLTGLSRGAGFAVLFAGLAILSIAFIAFFQPLAARALVGAWAFPDDREALFGALEERRTGPLRVPVERTITFFDVALDAPRVGGGDGEPARPVVRYRDLGHQQLASKKALAHAPCGFATLDWTAHPLAALLRAPPTKLVFDPCEGIDPAKAIDTGPIARDPVTGAPVSASYTLDDLVRVPVIQNDFIGAYVVTRFGMSGAAVLMLLQAMFVAGAAGLAFRIGRRQTADQTEASVARFLAIATGGILALFAIHWTIAWSNVMGLLPVMGQPMTWIAAATSHHLLMVVPALLLVVAAFRFVGHPSITPTFGLPRR